MPARFKTSIEWRAGLLAAITALLLIAHTFVGAISRRVSQNDLDQIEKLSDAMVGVKDWKESVDGLRAAVARAAAPAATASDVDALRSHITALASQNSGAEALLADGALPETIAASANDVIQPSVRYLESAREFASDLAAARTLAPALAASLDQAAAEQSNRLEQQESGILTAYRAAVAEARDRMSSEVWAAGALALMTCLLCAVLALVILRRVVRPIRMQVAAMRELAAGGDNVDIAGAEMAGDIGDMARSILKFRETIAKKRALESEAAAALLVMEDERRKKDDMDKYYVEAHGAFLSQFGLALERLAAGDVKHRVDQPFIEEYEGIRHAFNLATGKIQEAIVGIVSRSVEIRGGTDRILSAADELSRHTEEQASSLEETSASMEQMAATIRQNASNAQEASATAIVTRDLAVAGGKVAIKAASAMEKIERSSKQVTEIVSLIEEIAFQTNILALNAAVEAARAGDAGKGFAVVANEVRALSQRSSRSLKDIKSLIDSSAANVVEGAGLVRQAGDSLTEIVVSVKKSADLIAEIAAASQEQAAGVDQVSRAVANMDEMTQQNAALVQETTASLHAAQTWIHELNRVVSVFDTGVAAPIYAPVHAPAHEPGPHGNWVRNRHSHIEKQVKAQRASHGRDRHGAPAAARHAEAFEREWQEL